MNSYSVIAFFALLAAANAGILVGPSARIIQGPGSRTAVFGPDGGQIVREESLGVVAHTAPLLAAAPALAFSDPTLAFSARRLVSPAHSIISAPIVSAHSAPLISGVLGRSLTDTIIAGPSGTIATGRTLAAPLLSAW